MKTKEHLKNNRVDKREKLTPDQLCTWMDREGVSSRELSQILGVSEQVVKLWRTGGRTFSTTNTRLVQMFIKYPQLMKEF